MGDAVGDRGRLASEKLQKIMECEENGILFVLLWVVYFIL